MAEQRESVIFHCDCNSFFASVEEALNPYIGYENAAKTVKLAHKEDISLKEACVKLGFLTEDRFDEVFHPEQMV